MKRVVITSLLGLVLLGSASALSTTITMSPGDELGYICNGGTVSTATKGDDRGMIYCNAAPTANPTSYPPINPTPAAPSPSPSPKAQ